MITTVTELTPAQRRARAVQARKRSVFTIEGFDTRRWNGNRCYEMRPNVEALLTKIRHLSILDDPQVVEILVKDILHYRFVRQEQHPARLLNLMNSVMLYLQQSVGFDKNFNEELTNLETVTESVTETVLEAATPIGAEGEATEPVASTESMNVAVGPPTPNFAYWTMIREALVQHQLDEIDTLIYCKCNGAFKTSEDYNKHVRIRLKKAFMGESTAPSPAPVE